MFIFNRGKADTFKIRSVILFDSENLSENIL